MRGGVKGPRGTSQGAEQAEALPDLSVCQVPRHGPGCVLWACAALVHDSGRTSALWAVELPWRQCVMTCFAGVRAGVSAHLDFQPQGSTR